MSTYNFTNDERHELVNDERTKRAVEALRELTPDGVTVQAHGGGPMLPSVVIEGPDVWQRVVIPTGEHWRPLDLARNALIRYEQQRIYEHFGMDVTPTEMYPEDL
jgi:hypothetical protein